MRNIVVFIRILLAAVAMISAPRLSAQYRPRYHYYRPPPNYNSPRPRAPNQANRPPVTVEPEEKTQKFRDLPVNTEFYFLADRSRKLFPRIKISDTTAKSVPTPGNTDITATTIPGELIVLVKRDGQNTKSNSPPAKANPPNGKKTRKEP